MPCTAGRGTSVMRSVMRPGLSTAMLPVLSLPTAARIVGPPLYVGMDGGRCIECVAETLFFLFII